MKSAHNKLDLVGQTFERLTVVREEGRTPARKVKWLCKCSCGNKTIVATGDLRSGHVKSCGCFNEEKRKERNEGNVYGVKHGGCYTKLYNVWKQMRQRCGAETHKMFKHYGARGIKVCKEWEGAFNTFYAWSMKSGYREGLTLERIDNNDNYKPSNCAWITQKKQNINRRNTVKIGGIPIVDILEQHKVKEEDMPAVRARILSLGWSIEKAVNTPIKRR